MKVRILVNMPDPDVSACPGSRRAHYWQNGRKYDRETAERVMLDIVERGLVKNATWEEVDDR